MSTALSQAFVRAFQLSEDEQDALALVVTAEVEERSRRAGPESVLAKLGRAAWAEHEAGQTRPSP